jgi:hypothetical protein
MIKYGGKYYYNPALPEVQTHLIGSWRGGKIMILTRSILMIISILQNRGEEFDDSASFKKFSDGMSLADWDMNVNNFVKYCSYSIKK